MYNIIIMISHVYIITLLLFFQSALIKLGCRLSNETHDLLRHLLGSKYEKNPLFPSGPGDKKQKHGKWIKRKMIGTNVSYAHLSSSKSVGQWAKRVGVDAVMNIDDDGGGATISVTKMLNDDLTKKPKEHYQHLLENAVATVVNVGADAYNMYSGRPFTNLVYRLLQQCALASSYKAARPFAIYEGKDDHDKLQPYFEELRVFMEELLFHDMGPVPHRGFREDGLKPTDFVGPLPVVGEKVKARYMQKRDDGRSFFAAEVVARNDADDSYSVVFDGHAIGTGVMEIEYCDGTTQDVLIEFTGFGDLVFAREFQGQHYRFCDKYQCCNKCNINKPDLRKCATSSDTKTYVSLCHLAHMPAHQNDFPFTCPSSTCKKVFYTQVQVDADPEPMKSKKRDYLLAHNGQKHKCKPLLPIEPLNFDDCVMHERKCLTSLVYLHAIAAHITSDVQGDKLYRLMHDEHKIDIPKSKTRKQKKTDQEGDFMKKQSFQGANDLILTDHLREYIEVVSPSQVMNKQTRVMEDCHSNIAANGRALECLEKLVAWRTAVYTPLNDRYPSKAQLTRKHRIVKAAATAMFTTFERVFDTAIPYMHASLHCENYLKRDPLDCSAESLEHRNKRHKDGGKRASKWKPSSREDAVQFSTSAAVLRSEIALEKAVEIRGQLPSTLTERRAVAVERSRRTLDLTEAEKQERSKRKKGQLRSKKKK